MKKLTIVISFMLLLCLFFTISALAQEEEEPKGSDLFGETNVAPDAEVTARSNSWVQNGRGDEKYLPRLVDQDLGTGVGSSQYDHNISIYFTFDRLFTVDRLVLWFNQKTDNPTGVSGEPSLTDRVSGANQNFNFSVVLYDINENRIFQMDNINTLDQQEIIIVPTDKNGNRIYTEIYKVEYWQPCEYNPDNTLWEIEIHEHVCEFETVSSVTTEPTCTKEGIGTYKCECGKTKKNLPIPALGYHPLDEENPQILYENGILQEGEARNCCTLCDEYYEPYEIKPMFDFLGYSASFDKNSVCVGFAVNENELVAYEKANSVSLKYGAIISTTKADSYIDKNGNVLTASTVKKEAQDVDTLRFDIKLSTSRWDAIGDYELVMCAYVIDGENVYYLSSETEVATTPYTITYNKITKPQDEEAPII